MTTIRTAVTMGCSNWDFLFRPFKMWGQPWCLVSPRDRSWRMVPRCADPSTKQVLPSGLVKPPWLAA
jgi:hypothetical protein